MKRLSRLFFALGTLGSIIAGLIVASGRVDGLSHNGAASADVAFLSIILYWVLGACVCRQDHGKGITKDHGDIIKNCR